MDRSELIPGIEPVEIRGVSFHVAEDLKRAVPDSLRTPVIRELTPVSIVLCCAKSSLVAYAWLSLKIMVRTKDPCSSRASTLTRVSHPSFGLKNRFCLVPLVERPFVVAVTACMR